jgi:hypothetical protein
VQKSEKNLIFASWARNGRFGTFFEKNTLGPLGVKHLNIRLISWDIINYFKNLYTSISKNHQIFQPKGRHWNFEKYYNDKTKKYGIERLHDNFKVYKSMLEDIDGIKMYAKDM